MTPVVVVPSKNIWCQNVLSSIPITGRSRLWPFASKPSRSLLNRTLKAIPQAMMAIPDKMKHIYLPDVEVNPLICPLKLLGFLEVSKYVKAFSLIRNAASAVVRALWPDDAQQMIADLMATGFTFPSKATLAKARPQLDASAMLCERYEWNYGLF